MDWDAVAGRFTPPARLAVIGDPIGHSRSPQMHNPALQACGIDAQYIRVQVPVGRVAEAFRQFAKCGFLGVNITIPHKFEALDAVDVLDPLARQLGARGTGFLLCGLQAAEVAAAGLQGADRCQRQPLQRLQQVQRADFRCGVWRVAGRGRHGLPQSRPCQQGAG